MLSLKRLMHIIRKRKFKDIPEIRISNKRNTIILFEYAINNKLLSRKSLSYIDTELCNITGNFCRDYDGCEDEILYRLDNYKLCKKDYRKVIGIINDLIAAEKDIKKIYKNKGDYKNIQ